MNFDPPYHEVDLKTDNRGYFTRLFDCFSDSWSDFGKILNVNESFSPKLGTFRGFHMQMSPFAEEKILRCVSGKLLNITVCLDLDSTDFGSVRVVELSAGDTSVNLVRKGWANSIVTLEVDTRLTYFVTQVYSPEHEICISHKSYFFPEELRPYIKVVSEKDDAAPSFADMRQLREYIENV